MPRPAAFADRPTSTSRSCGRSSTAGPASRSTRAGCARRRGETYPAGPVVARFRELGGRRVSAGSDAHRAGLVRRGARRRATGSWPRPGSTSWRSGAERSASRSRCPRGSRSRRLTSHAPDAANDRADGPRRGTGVHRAAGSASAPRTSSGTVATRSSSTSARGRSPTWPARSSRARSGRSSISHLHPDHFIDLVPLRHYLNGTSSRRDASRSSRRPALADAARRPPRRAGLHGRVARRHGSRRRRTCVGSGRSPSRRAGSGTPRRATASA